MVTTKEINVLARKCTDGLYEYVNFCEDLYDVRYELARARYLDTNLD